MFTTVSSKYQADSEGMCLRRNLVSESDRLISSDGCLVLEHILQFIMSSIYHLPFTI